MPALLPYSFGDRQVIGPSQWEGDHVGLTLGDKGPGVFKGILSITVRNVALICIPFIISTVCLIAIIFFVNCPFMLFVRIPPRPLLIFYKFLGALYLTKMESFDSDNKNGVLWQWNELQIFSSSLFLVVIGCKVYEFLVVELNNFFFSFLISES